MSREIDERVVEMRFDNRQFETNVRTSISTLDKLKNSLNLNGAAKGLEGINDAAKKCDMSALGKSVDTIKVKFSALEIAAMTVFSSITNSALNAGKRIASAFTIEPVTTGFNEYELKMSSIQTIMAGTGESLERVNQKLDELNLYSDKTIYSFSDMTQNIGKFTNAGVKLDDAVAAIQGVANVAAVSGANANEASRAMYNFGQALSSGYVKLIDWKSIENANMATVEFKQQLMDTAVKMGTLVKVGEKYQSTTTDLNGHVSELFNSTLLFNDSLSAQWMTTEVLSKTLAKYADETTEIGKKAFAAAQDVKTFSQLMDTLKESAQSGWAETWQLIVGDFEEAKKLFTVMSNGFGEIISDSAKARNSILRGGLSSGWDELREKVEACGIPLDAFKERLAEIGKKHGVLTDKMVQEAGSLEGTFSKGWVSGKIFSETLLSFIDTATGFSAATDKVTGSLEELEKVAARVIRGDFGNGTDRVKALTAAGYDYAAVQSMVNHILIGTELELEKMSDAQLKSVGYTEEQIKMMRALAKEAEESGTSMDELLKKLTRPSPREMIIQSVSNAVSGLTAVLKTVRGAWQDIFPPEEASRRIYNLISAIYDFSQKLKVTEEEMNTAGGTMDKLRRTFKGLFAVLDIFTTLTGGAFKAAMKAAAKLLGMVDVDILSITANVGDAIVAFRDWIDQHNILAQGIEKALPYLQSGIKTLRDWIAGLGELPIVERTLTRFGGAFQNLGEGFNAYLKGGIEQIKAFADRVKALDSLTLDNVLIALADFRDNVLGYFLNFGGIFDGLIQAVKDFGSDIQTAFVQFTGGAENAAAGMKTAAGKVIQFMLDMKERIFSIALEIREKLADKIGFSEIFALGLGAAMVAFTKKISDALGVIAAPFEGIGSLLESASKGIGKVLKSVSKALNAFAMETKSKALLNIAKAILVLVGALAILTLLDQEKLKGAMIVLGILAAGLLAVSFAMSKMGDPKELVKLSVSIVAVGGCLLLLANAMKTLESLDSDKTGGSLLILAALAAGLVAVSKLLSSKDQMFSQSAVFLLGFALSLKILVGVLKDLDKLELNNVGQTMALLLGAVASLALVAAVCKNIKFGAAATILAVVVSLKLLVGVFEDIAGIDIGQAKRSMGMFAGIFSMFAVLMAASKFAGENTSKAGSAIFKMSAALILIVTAFKMIAGIDPSDLDRATNTVAKLLLVFAAVTAASYFAGKNASKAGTMLLLMSAAIMVLSATMVVLSHLDPSGLGRALAAISTLLIVFGAMVGITYFAKDSSEVQGTLITLTVAISAMVAAIAALSMLDPKRLLGATLALTSLVAVFSLLVASTHFAEKAGGTLAVMTAVVAGLAAILAVMSVLDVQNAIENAAGLSILLISMSASLLILSKADDIAPMSLAAIGIMTAVVAGLGAILGIMDGLGVEASIKTAVSLSILLNSMSAALLILSKADDIAPMSLAAIGIMTAVVAGLAAILGVMDGLGVEASIKTAVSLSVLLTSMSASLLILSKAGDISPKSLAAIGIMTAVVAGLAAILGVMDGLGVEASIETSASLSVLLLSMSGACLILSKVGATGPAVFIGIGALATLIAGMGGIMAAICALTAENPTVEEDLDRAISVLEKIGSGLGAVIGGFVGGALGGLTSGLPIIGTNLAGFMTNAQPFFDTVKGIDPEAMNGVKALAETLLILTGVKAVDGLTSWLTGGFSMSDFAEQLVPLGEAMLKFSDTITGLDGDLVSTAAIAGKTLAEMAATLPNSGGVLGYFAGENDMEEFGRQLVPFGKAIKEYAEAVNGLDVDAVTNSATAGKALTELAHTVPNAGGAIAFFTGDNDLAVFSEQIVIFGKAIKEYADAVAELDTDAVANSATAGSALVELAKTVPNTGGLISFFVGDNDLASFGQGLVSFAESMKTYSAALEGINDLSQTVAKTKLLAAMMDTLAALSEKLPQSGGFLSVFVGNNDLETFGEGAAKFAESMVTYSAALDKLKNISQTAAKTKLLAAMMDTLAALSAKLPKSGGFLSVFTGNNDLKAFGTGAAKFAESMKAYVAAMNETGDIASVTEKTKALTTMTEALIELSELANNLGKDPFRNFKAAMKQLGDAGVKAFVDATTGSGAELDTAVSDMMETVKAAVEDKETSLVQSMKKILSSLVKAIEDKKQEMEKAGKDLMKQLAGGMTEGKKVLTSAIEEAAVSVSGLRDKFYACGVNIANGLKDGIRSQRKLVILTSVQVANDALSETANAAGCHSPSTKFAEIGSYMAQGLAQGIQNGVPDVRRASKDMANEALHTAKDTFDKQDPSHTFTYEIVNEGTEYASMAEVGEQMDAELAAGITANAEQAKDAAKETVRDILQEAKDEVERSVQYNADHGFYVMKPVEIAQAVQNKVAEKLRKDLPPELKTDSWGMDQEEQARAVLEFLNQYEAYRQAVKEVEEAKKRYANKELYYVAELGRWMDNWDIKKYNTDVEAERFQHDEDYVYLGEHLGENMAIGFHMGIVSESDPAVKELQDKFKEGQTMGWKYTFSAAEDQIEYLKELGQLTTAQELALWQGFMETNVGEYEDRMELNEKVYALEQQLVEDTYQYSLDWIEREKNANRLSKEEEIAGYERMLPRYREGSKQRLEIQEKLNRALMELDDERYQNALDWIEKEKNYGGLGLAGELAAYKRMSILYANNAQRKAAADQKILQLEKELSEAQEQYIKDVQEVQAKTNDERVKLEEEYANKVKSVNEQLERDIKQANDAYESSLKSRTDALYRTYGLFDEVTLKEEADSELLMKNLEDQVLEFNQWQDILGSLSARGLDGELMDELRAMGPSALGELKALSSMSDSELTKYQALWKDKHIQTRQQALSELEGLRKQTQDNIARMRDDAKKELEKYQSEWNKKMAKLTADTNAELERLRTNFAKKIGLIRENSEAQLSEMAMTAQEILRAAGWDETGQQIVDGMTAGIEARKSSFLDALTEMALAGAEVVQDTLEGTQAASSSAPMGLVNGLTNYVENVGNAVGSYKEVLSNAITQLPDLMRKGANSIPSIRPVVELPGKYSSAGNSSALLHPQSSTFMAREAGTAFAAAGTRENTVSTADNREVVQELRSLRGDMSDMAQRMERMRIVLDTGKLVGEMTGRIDNALGQIANYRKRGI